MRPKHVQQLSAVEGPSLVPPLGSTEYEYQMATLRAVWMLREALRHLMAHDMLHAKDASTVLLADGTAQKDRERAHYLEEIKRAQALQVTILTQDLVESLPAPPKPEPYIDGGNALDGRDETNGVHHDD